MALLACTRFSSQVIILHTLMPCRHLMSTNQMLSIHGLFLFSGHSYDKLQQPVSTWVCVCVRLPLEGFLWFQGPPPSQTRIQHTQINIKLFFWGVFSLGTLGEGGHMVPVENGWTRECIGEAWLAHKRKTSHFEEVEQGERMSIFCTSCICAKAPNWKLVYRHSLLN